MELKWKAVLAGSTIVGLGLGGFTSHVSADDDLTAGADEAMLTLSASIDSPLRLKTKGPAWYPTIAVGSVGSTGAGSVASVSTADRGSASVASPSSPVTPASASVNQSANSPVSPASPVTPQSVDSPVSPASPVTPQSVDSPATPPAPAPDSASAASAASGGS